MAKHLQFTRDYWDDLIHGRKTLTIRYGKVTEFKEGDIVFIHCGGYVLGKAQITKVEYKKFSELTDEEAFLEGFSSKSKLKDALKKHYPQIKSSDWITVIRFRWIEKYDEPILSEEFAWKGVSLPPRKIAELALKHLEDMLTEKQKEYLKLVIREGSIRKAAIKLGGLHKRILFRKIFRKVLDELIKKGIIKVED